MAAIVLLLFLSYYLLVVFLLTGWRRAMLPGKRSSEIRYLSVVVPLRNEEEHCHQVLTSLAEQNYPKDKVEFILVNDHSTDETEKVLKQWMESNLDGSFRVLSLEEGQKGKKAAINEAIKKAKGEIIVTSDADCQFHSNWLLSISQSFSRETQLVVGPVRLTEKGHFFSALQSMEFASLIGVGASTLAWGWPTMCNGANLAYRKRAFDEVNGFSGNDHIASGDDEFLLRKIKQRYPDGVRFNNSSGSIVTAKPSDSIRSFIQQRIRWAGKWRNHGFGLSAVLAVYIFIFYCSVIALLPLTMYTIISLQDTILLLSGKMFFEAVWIHRITKFLKISFSPISFLVLQFVFPLYVIFFALTANFLRTEWKDRKI